MHNKDIWDYTLRMVGKRSKSKRSTGRRSAKRSSSRRSSRRSTSRGSAFAGAVPRNLDRTIPVENHHGMPTKKMNIPKNSDQLEKGGMTFGEMRMKFGDLEALRIWAEEAAPIHDSRVAARERREHNFYARENKREARAIKRGETYTFRTPSWSKFKPKKPSVKKISQKVAKSKAKDFVDKARKRADEIREIREELKNDPSNENLLYQLDDALGKLGKIQEQSDNMSQAVQDKVDEVIEEVNQVIEEVNQEREGEFEDYDVSRIEYGEGREILRGVTRGSARKKSSKRKPARRMKASKGSARAGRKRSKRPSLGAALIGGTRSSHSYKL